MEDYALRQPADRVILFVDKVIEISNLELSDDLIAIAKFTIRLGHMTIGFHNFIVNTKCDFLWLIIVTI
jgi:hypothetical protein